MTISAARRTRDNPIARVACDAADTFPVSPTERLVDCHDVGNISTMTQDDGTVWDYDYDGRYRLTSAARDNAGESPTISATYTYAYDDGDNLLSKTEPFLEDFEDGDMTGWTQSGYTASNRYAQRTAADNSWRRFERSQTDADLDLRFSYACGDASDSNYRIYAFVRRPDASNWVAVFLYPGWAKIAQRIEGGSYQYLDTEAIATTEDAWYDVRVVADGANVTVWRGEKGGAMEKILETSSASITTTSYLRFENAPYSDYRVDDIQLIGGSLSNTTTAFTYDSGNELSTRTLNSVTSNFPGESNVSYDYGGGRASRPLFLNWVVSCGKERRKVHASYRVVLSPDPSPNCGDGVLCISSVPCIAMVPCPNA
jgi:YD repeat-containing protein